MTTDLSAEQIQGSLTGGFGSLIRYFDEIGSTNSEALEWAMCGGPEGAIVAADHQTLGRGRWGRTWFSAPGKLLQFSVILRPKLEPARAGILTTGIGVACARAIKALTGVPVQIKWPNDIVVEARKLAGILVESTTMGSTIDAAICGIGINVHLRSDEIPEDLRDRASSLAIEMGGRAAPERARLLARIVGEIEGLYPAMTSDPAALLDEAGSLSAVLGRAILVRAADGSTTEGRAEGFESDGALRVSTSTGEAIFHVGEIEQLRPV